MKNDLFRSTALEAAEVRYGAPLRQYGVAGWALTGFLVLLLAGAVTFLSVTQYARKETVTGSLTPATGSQNLVPSRSGVVEVVFAEEGQLVEAGAPIIRISHDSIGENGESIAALVQTASAEEAAAAGDQQQARMQIIESQVAELDARLWGLRSDVEQLGQARHLSTSRLQLATEAVDAARKLHEGGLMARLPLAQREDAWLALRQQDATLQREETSIRSQILQLTAQRSRLVAERQDVEAGRTKEAAQFDERRATLLKDRGQVLAAHTAGRVASLQAKPGGFVQSGQSLGTILPKNAGLVAELWVPSRAVGFLKQGSSVRLLYDAFPYQKFGVGRGQVMFVSQSPTNPMDMSPPSDSPEPLYRVLVAIERQSISVDGASLPLTPGMRLSADLILEERTLLAWLLKPFFSAVRRSQAA